MSGRLAGKVVLITGTAGGQGAAAKERFEQEGATVVGCDLPDVDLGDPVQARDWIDASATEHDGFDVLYNNAGAARFASIADMSDDDWHAIVRNELDLVFHTCRAAWPHLVSRGGGAIVNTASVCGMVALPSSPGAFAHAATKGAVIAMTRELALEGGPHNIRANSLSPGPVTTPANAHRMADPEVRRAHRALMMSGRLGRVDDVANAALFLASDESGWMTGTNLVVDGGLSAS
jgi:NAD(P)-dependent dehydrogenase (short-subunit alcohol dehydrogenase family)